MDEKLHHEAPEKGANTDQRDDDLLKKEVREAKAIVSYTKELLASTAAAIGYLTRVISMWRASRVRWWYQCEQAWWRRRQSSQCPALPGGGGWPSRRPVSGTVSGIIPGWAGGG
jgi:hypothetical protein